MRFLLSVLLLCVLSFSGGAAIYSRKAAPALHSIFDNGAAPAKQISAANHQPSTSAFFYEPYPTPDRHQTKPGDRTAVIGGVFLAGGLLGSIAYKITAGNQTKSSDDVSLLLLGSLLFIIVGVALFVTGAIISTAHRRHSVPQDDRNL
jgi:hypothetical protein